MFTSPSTLTSRQEPGRLLGHLGGGARPRFYRRRASRGLTGESEPAEHAGEACRSRGGEQGALGEEQVVGRVFGLRDSERM